MPRDDMMFRPAPELREIVRDLKAAHHLMWRLYHINADRIGFFREITCERTNKVAEVVQLDALWRSVLGELGAYWKWIIVVYGYHAERKSIEWLRLVIYHELRHIGIDGKKVEHNVEDWRDILKEFGIEWLDDGNVPDILMAKPTM